MTASCTHQHLERADLGQLRCIHCGHLIGRPPTTDYDRATAQLAELPGLAREVWDTRYAPNPTPRANRLTRTPPGSKPPTRLALVDVYRLDEKGHLATLWGAVDAIHKHRGDHGLTEPALPHATWQHAAAWLASTHTWWDGQHNLVGPVTAAIAYVHQILLDLARPPRTGAYPCTRTGCPGTAHPQPGGQWMRCEYGHEVEGIGAARARLQRRGPMTAQQIESEYGIKAATVRRWKSDGLITPTGTIRANARGRSADLWNPWDVLQIEHAERVQC
ncbi:hypothetical protein ACQBAU_16245 [Propionibacteriaceae bacterium Y2011]